MKILDFKVGMKIQSLRFGSIETIVTIDYWTGAFRTNQRYYRSYEYGIEWKFYVPEFDGPQDAATHVKLEDYQSLLEFAFELNDKGWYEEICTTINQLKAGEQHA